MEDISGFLWRDWNTFLIEFVIPASVVLLTVFARIFERIGQHLYTTSRGRRSRSVQDEFRVVKKSDFYLGTEIACAALLTELLYIGRVSPGSLEVLWLLLTFFVIIASMLITMWCKPRDETERKRYGRVLLWCLNISALGMYFVFVRFIADGR